MRSFILGFICAALVFTGLHYHFILTSKDLIVSRKDKVTFVDTVVDTRSWSAGDYFRNPGITLTLRKKGLGQVVDDAVSKLVPPEEKEKEKAGASKKK